MTAIAEDTREFLRNFTPEHGSFVGVDSDGCVFDTMAAKQTHCIHPRIIAHWRLEAIEPLLRETAEFVNLRSKWRGGNRFPSLLRMFDLLRQRPEVRAAGIAIPQLPSLRRFVKSGLPLGNDSLARQAAESGDAELADVRAWSEEVNANIAQTVNAMPPFEWARTGLERIAASCDAICVSQTPTEALVREWDACGLSSLVRLVAGQECGSKAEQIAQATRSRYGHQRVLIIGDALGDLEAARTNEALFYPIKPGSEVDSWRRFVEEAYDRFLDGRYAGAYEDEEIRNFQALLPDTPPWQLGEK